MIELIIDGIYGCRDIHTNQIVPKKISDGPFETLKELEEDAVKRGIARYVLEETNHENIENKNNLKDIPVVEISGYSKNIEAENNVDDTTEAEILHNNKIRPDYSEEMKVTDLKALAENVGIDASKCIKRIDVIALLDEYYDGLEKEEEKEEDEEIISDSEEPTPVFDALDSVK